VNDTVSSMQIATGVDPIHCRDALTSLMHIKQSVNPCRICSSSCRPLTFIISRGKLPSAQLRMGRMLVALPCGQDNA
jgi:hypothetical protein